MDCKEYIVFKIMDEEYAIDIKRIHEINRLKEIKITSIPKVPYYIEGIINLRGEVVPILSLRKKFKLEESPISNTSRIIIVNIYEKRIGVLVDSVSSVISFEDFELSNPPEEFKVNCEYILNIGNKDNRLIFILDIDKVLE